MLETAAQESKIMTLKYRVRDVNAIAQAYQVRLYTYQVVLQRVWPDVILDDLSKLISTGISMISEPSEEALWLFMLPLPP